MESFKLLSKFTVHSLDAAVACLVAAPHDQLLDKPQRFNRPPGQVDPWHGQKTRACSATVQLDSVSEALDYLSRLKRQFHHWYERGYLGLAMAGAETAPGTSKPHVHVSLRLGAAAGGPRSSAYFQGMLLTTKAAFVVINTHKATDDYEYICKRVKNGIWLHRSFARLFRDVHVHDGWMNEWIRRSQVRPMHR